MIHRTGRGLWGVALLFAATLPLSAGQDFWTGNGPEGGMVSSLAVDPGSPSLVYAVTRAGLYRSTDAAVTWTPIGQLLPAVFTVAVDPTTASALFVRGQDNRIFRSTDAGLSWSEESPVPIGIAAVGPMIFDPSPPGALFAASNGELYRSPTPIVTWSRSDSGLPGDTILDLALEPGSPSVLYAALTSGVFRSADGGTTWTATSSLPIATQAVLSVKTLPGSPNTVFAGISDGRIYRSVDGGGVWTLNTTVTNKNISALAVSASSVSTIYAGTPGGVYLSTNGGDTWSLTPGSPSSLSSNVVLAVAPSNSGFLYLGNPRGAYRSSNSGNSWFMANAGLRSTTVTSIAIDPITPNIVFATDDSSRVVFRSANGGQDWSQVSQEGVENVIAIAPSSHLVVYAGGSAGVFRSIDGGLTFSPTSLLPPVYDLAIDPSNADTAYAATTMGVYRTIGGGAGWFQTFPGLNTSIRRLALDPANSQVLYALLTGGILQKSTDGGSHWAPLPFPGSNVNTLLVTGGSPSMLYAFDLVTGLFVSVDQGSTWTPTGIGLPTLSVTCLVADPVVRSTIYAGMGVSGVWRSTDGGDRFVPFSPGLTGRQVLSLAISPNGRLIVAGADSAGAFTYTITSNSFYTVPPCRILDTRDAIGPYGGPGLAANVPRSVMLAGRCGVPATARALAANVAVTQPLAAGFLAAWQGQTADPGTSTLNFKLGQTRSTNATLVLGPAGDVLFNLNMSSGSADVIVDVTGYYAP